MATRKCGNVKNAKNAEKVKNAGNAKNAEKVKNAGNVLPNREYNTIW